jgi:hypothetical protein
MLVLSYLLDIPFANVTVRLSASTGLRLQHPESCFYTVENLTVTDNAYSGLSLYLTAATCSLFLVDSSIVNNGADGVSIDAAFQANFTNVNFFDNGFSPSDMMMMSGPAALHFNGITSGGSIAVTQCHFRNNSAGLFLDPMFYSSNYVWYRVRDSLFEFTRNAISLAGWADTVSGVELRNNTFQNVSGQVVYLAGFASSSVRTKTYHRSPTTAAASRHFTLPSIFFILLANNRLTTFRCWEICFVRIWPTIRIKRFSFNFPPVQRLSSQSPITFSKTTLQILQSFGSMQHHHRLTLSTFDITSLSTIMLRLQRFAPIISTFPTNATHSIIQQQSTSS